MPIADITASLKGFRTPRTLPDYTRKIAIPLPIPEKGKNRIGKGRAASVLNVLTPPEPEPLPPDQAAWLPVAGRILAVGFDGCDRSTGDSITIGLRSIAHPLCRKAHERLKAAKEAGR